MQKKWFENKLYVVHQEWMYLSLVLIRIRKVLCKFQIGCFDTDVESLSCYSHTKAKSWQDQVER